MLRAGLQGAFIVAYLLTVSIVATGVFLYKRRHRTQEAHMSRGLRLAIGWALFVVLVGPVVSWVIIRVATAGD